MSQQLCGAAEKMAFQFDFEVLLLKGLQCFPATLEFFGLAPEHPVVVVYAISDL